MPPAAAAPNANCSLREEKLQQWRLQLQLPLGPKPTASRRPAFPAATPKSMIPVRVKRVTRRRVSDCTSGADFPGSALCQQQRWRLTGLSRHCKESSAEKFCPQRVAAPTHTQRASETHSQMHLIFAHTAMPFACLESHRRLPYPSPREVKRPFLQASGWQTGTTGMAQCREHGERNRAEQCVRLIFAHPLSAWRGVVCTLPCAWVSGVG